MKCAPNCPDGSPHTQLHACVKYNKDPRSWKLHVFIKQLPEKKNPVEKILKVLYLSVLIHVNNKEKLSWFW